MCDGGATKKTTSCWCLNDLLNFTSAFNKRNQTTMIFHRYTSRALVVLLCTAHGFQVSLPTKDISLISRQRLYDSSPGGEDDVPSMDWLTDTLSKPQRDDDADDATRIDLTKNTYMEEHTADGDLGDVPIPTTGVSVADEMDNSQRDRFFTELVPIKGLGKGDWIVRILPANPYHTTASSGSSQRISVGNASSVIT